MAEPKKTTLAITVGDINGIGPEIILKVLPHLASRPDVRILLVDPPRALEVWKAHLDVPPVPIRSCSVADPWEHYAESVILLSETPTPRETIEIGKATAHSGDIAVAALRTAVALARKKKVDAVVTAPVSKYALRLAGYTYSGQTEYLAEMCGVSHPVMMLLADRFRVAVATRHIPLKEVANHLTQQLLEQTLEVLIRELRQRFGIPRPRIAVAGLNPHAGEGGELGNEERDIIFPVVHRFQQRGYHVSGPYAADALFSRIHERGSWDVYLAMYHDQGLIPLKMYARGRGVNYTCGLPIIRTSPDHGTAYDIAGKNVADPASMMEAVTLALELAQKG